MKQSQQCPKCRSVKVGRLSRLPDYRHGAQDEARNLGRSYSGGLFSSKENVADVEAYVCTECGYFEEYVAAPHEVDWEDLPFFSYCQSDAGGPRPVR